MVRGKGLVGRVHIRLERGMKVTRSGEKISMAFWIVISSTTDRRVEHTERRETERRQGTERRAHPRTCAIELFDRQPASDVSPLYRITQPSHWPLTLQASRDVDAGKDALQTYGDAIAHWLLCEQDDPTTLNPIGERLKTAANELDQAQELRLFVYVVPSLLNTPEFLYHGFLQCLSANTLVPLEAVRSVPGVNDDSDVRDIQSRQPVADQLRVLVALSNPDDCPANIAAESKHLPSLDEDFTTLIAALTPLQEHGGIRYEVLRQPSGPQLEAMLQSFNPHVFVFLGHGYHDARGAGLICVEQGPAYEWLPKEWGYDRLKHSLGTIQQGADLRLVVLVACRSFAAAPGLLRLGIPAVVGMQKYRSHDFPSAGVTSFVVPFFKAVSDFHPVAVAFADGVKGLQETKWQDEAMEQARQAPHYSGQDGATWLAIQQCRVRAAAVMPTLWLAGQEDRLFAESEQRLRASYRTALSNKVAMCEWSGKPGQVPLQKVVVLPSLVEAGTNQEVDLESILSKSKAVLLRGGEWSGKTTLAHWVVLTTFERNHKTPLVVNLREMDRTRQSLEQWVVESCRRWLGLNSPEQVATLLMEDCRRGNAMLVIDDVDRRWLEQHPSMLQQRLFGKHEADHVSSLVVTSRAWEDVSDAHWLCLQIQALSSEQRHSLAERYGQVLDFLPATKDFLQRVAKASERPEGVTALASRPGFWAEMLAHFLRQMVLLTDEADLLDRLQENRWRKPVESPKMVQPDEPVYKQQILEAAGFHTYFCRSGSKNGCEVGLVTQSMITAILQFIDFGEGPVYPLDLATRLLQEHVEIRPFLQGGESVGWVFLSQEWTRFYAASQIAALVNDQDQAVLGWMEGGKSLRCRSCEMDLGTFKERVAPERLDQVLGAVAAVKEEDLPAWRRTDPWDCPAVRELRRVLVRALPLKPRG